MHRSLSKLQEMGKSRGAWRAAVLGCRVRHAGVAEQQPERSETLTRYAVDEPHAE